MRHCTTRSIAVRHGYHAHLDCNLVIKEMEANGYELRSTNTLQGSEPRCQNVVLLTFREIDESFPEPEEPSTGCAWCGKPVDLPTAVRIYKDYESGGSELTGYMHPECEIDKKENPGKWNQPYGDPVPPPQAYIDPNWKKHR